MTFEQIASEIAYLRASMDRMETMLRERLTDHECRLRRLEACWWRLAGVIGVLAAIASTVASAAIRHFIP